MDEIWKLREPRKSPLFRQKPKAVLLFFLSLVLSFSVISLSKSKQPSETQSLRFFFGLSRVFVFFFLFVFPIKSSMTTLDSDVTMVPAGEASGSAVPSSSTKKLKRFEIKKWSAVALWAWGNHKEKSLKLSWILSFDVCVRIFIFGLDTVLLIGLCLIADIVVDNCAICRNHIMDLCKS